MQDWTHAITPLLTGEAQSIDHALLDDKSADYTLPLCGGLGAVWPLLQLSCLPVSVLDLTPDQEPWGQMDAFLCIAYCWL